jgi:uncharacterized Zn-finger protein
VEPIRGLLDVAGSLYVQLEARTDLHHGSGGRRIQPGSKAPVRVDVVSHLEELRRFLASWAGEARAKLDPVQWVDLTAREGVRCPWCDGRLMAVLQDQRPETSQIRCQGKDHSSEDGPKVWTPDQWRRLGLLAGTVVDLRQGPQMPMLEEATG